MKKQLLFIMGIVFILALCSMHRAYVAFSIANRGIWDEMVKDMRFFYGYITLTGATLRWYLVSGLIVWLAVQKLKNLRAGWLKWTTITGLIALFLAPGIFVAPDQAPAPMFLLSAADFKSPSTVWPAWVSLLGYSIVAPSFLYGLLAI